MAKQTKHIGRRISPLGLAIQQLRAERRLSQQKLADRAGISRSAIAKVVTGESDTMTIESAEKLAKVFDMTINELLDMRRAPDPRAFTDYLKSPWALLDKPTAALKERLRRKLRGAELEAGDAPPIDPKAVHELLEVLKRWPRL